MKFKGPVFPSFLNQQTPAPRRQWVAHCGTRARARGLRQLAKKESTTMSSNGKPPIPFQAPAGTPLIGQPFSILTVGVPMNMTLTCNCGAADERPVLVVQMSAFAVCPTCRKQYSAFFNPQTGQTHMVINAPADEGVPA